MTVYESFEASTAIWSDAGFSGAPEYGAFLGAYPPAGGCVPDHLREVGRPPSA